MTSYYMCLQLYHHVLVLLNNIMSYFRVLPQKASMKSHQHWQKQVVKRFVILYVLVLLNSIMSYYRALPIGAQMKSLHWKNKLVYRLQIKVIVIINYNVNSSTHKCWAICTCVYIPNGILSYYRTLPQKAS